MVEIFARVELVGDPEWGVYEDLHVHMAALNWSRTVTGTDTVELPDEMYYGNFPEEVPDLWELANELKAGIEDNLWPDALVFLVRSVEWAQTAD